MELIPAYDEDLDLFIESRSPSIRDAKLKPFKLQSCYHQPIRRISYNRNLGQPTAPTSLLRTIDWRLIGSCAGLTVVSTLILANGQCSNPHGFSADFPICVGGDLSIQAWLSILGLEFLALVALVILPAQKAVLSKLLTSRLSSDEGMDLARFLSSPESSPFRTQSSHGRKTNFGVKVLGLCVVIIMSILYKFSFIQVARHDTLSLSGEEAPIMMGYSENGRYGVSLNLLDVLGGSNIFSSINSSLDPTNNTAGMNYTQVFGPSPGNAGNQLANGDLFLCTPTYYSRNTISGNAIGWTPPAINSSSSSDKIRFTYDSFILDIFSPDGNLQILAGEYGQADIPDRYVSMVSADINVCSGYTSWSVNNTSSQKNIHLHDPIDIYCISEPFNLSIWKNSSEFSTQFPLNLIQDLSSPGDIATAPSTAMSVILAALNHTDTIKTLESSLSLGKTPIFSICTTMPNSTFVQTGTFSSLKSTAFILPGIIFQCLIALTSLLTVLLLFHPKLTLVTECMAGVKAGFSRCAGRYERARGG